MLSRYSGETVMLFDHHDDEVRLEFLYGHGNDQLTIKAAYLDEPTRPDQTYQIRHNEQTTIRTTDGQPVMIKHCGISRHGVSLRFDAHKTVDIMRGELV